jgi:hypothetical protein
MSSAAVLAPSFGIQLTPMSGVLRRVRRARRARRRNDAAVGANGN